MSNLELDAPYTPYDRILAADLREAKLDVARPGPTSTAGWIVCRGGERLTSGCLVACPVGRAVPIDDCLACRFLEAVEDERDTATSCATDAIADYATAASAHHDVTSTSYELALELL